MLPFGRNKRREKRCTGADVGVGDLDVAGAGDVKTVRVWALLRSNESNTGEARVAAVCYGDVVSRAVSRPESANL